jgi:thiol-disulfide isomerase/thioredoxin
MLSRATFYRIAVQLALGAATCILTTASGCNTSTSTNQTPTQLTNASVESATAESVTLKILDYDAIQQLIASHHGQIVVLDCWSTSCPPCIEEFPKLVALHKQYNPSQLACISLSFDFEGPGKPEEVEPDILKFLRSQHATFENILGSEPSDTLLKKMNLASVPAVFVYDHQDNVYRFEGNKAYDEVIPLVQQLIDNK